MYFMHQDMFKLRLTISVFLCLVLILVAMAVSVSQAADAVSGPVAGSDTSTISGGDFGKPNLSRIWYNSHQNSWDALVPKNDGGVSASDHYIMKDVAGSQIFTAVELEDRNTARADDFWDDGNKKLYVLGSHATQSQFWRVGYDEIADSYSIELGSTGTGVTVPGVTHADSNRPASLYVSPNGDVWVAVMKDTALQVQHSDDGGATWMAAPITLDTSVALGVTTWIHFEDQGITYVGVFAGENGEALQVTFFYFWYIDQNADPSLLANWNDDSPNIPIPVGSERADDHVSAARDVGENQYFAVKTEGGAATDPLIKLYKRTPGGTWAQFTVTETQEVPEQSRPSIVVNKETAEIFIYTNDTVGGDGNRMQASLGALEDLADAPLTTVFSSPGKAFFDIITPLHGRWLRGLEQSPER